MSDPIQEIARQLHIQTLGDGLLAKIRQTIDLLQEAAVERDALRAEAEALRAELATIKGQEPVAIASKGDGVFWVKWTDAGKPLRGPGIKLYTLPDAPEGGAV